MRWSTENENILWRTIFQTQALNIELDKVSEAWPGDEKPTPKALKEKLDKYRCSASNKVKLSMGKNPSGSSPRKARTKKSTAAFATESSPTPDDQTANRTLGGAKDGPVGAFLSSPTAGGDSSVGHVSAAIDGIRTGRGRGRPRKYPVKDTTVKDTPVKKEDDQLDADVGPASKKIKTEGMSLSPSHSRIEILVPDNPLSSRFKTKNNKKNTQPRLKTKRKRSFKDIENTEEYVRCGQDISCGGGGCGKPGCDYCFGDWNGELDSPRG